MGGSCPSPKTADVGISWWRAKEQQRADRERESRERERERERQAFKPGSPRLSTEQAGKTPHREGPCPGAFAHIPRL